eukprot:gene9967-11182_t
MGDRGRHRDLRPGRDGGVMLGVVDQWWGDEHFGYVDSPGVRVCLSRRDLVTTYEPEVGDTARFTIEYDPEPQMMPTARDAHILTKPRRREPQVAHQTVTDGVGEMMQGATKNYDNERKDVFFHVSGVTDRTLFGEHGNIEQGTKVEFRLEKGNKPGSVQAEGIRRLTQGGRARRGRERTRSPPGQVQPFQAQPLAEAAPPAPSPMPQDPARIAAVASLLKGLSPDQITAVMAGAGHAAGCALAAMTQPSSAQ